MNAVLSENLKKCRLKMNLSQEEVARAINKTRGTYSRYENGTLEPDINTLITLADLYKTPTDILLGRISTAEEWMKAWPGVVIGQMIGDAINRQRVKRKLKKPNENKEPPSANTEGEE